jgi:hypothetical protein
MSKFYSFNLSVGGDFPLGADVEKIEKQLRESIDSDFSLESYTREDMVSVYLNFVHPVDYAYDDFFWFEYQPWFVERFENNLVVFNSLGFNDFTLWMNFYVVMPDEDSGSGFPQCSFQVLDKDLSARLFKHGVNAPFDVFVVSKSTAADYLKIPLNSSFFDYL